VSGRRSSTMRRIQPPAQLVDRLNQLEVHLVERAGAEAAHFDGEHGTKCASQPVARGMVRRQSVKVAGAAILALPRSPGSKSASHLFPQQAAASASDLSSSAPATDGCAASAPADELVPLPDAPAPAPAPEPALDGETSQSPRHRSRAQAHPPGASAMASAREGTETACVSSQRTSARHAQARRDQLRLEALLKWKVPQASTVQQMPEWWQVSRSPGLKAAARRFDEAHAKRTVVALHTLESTNVAPSLHPDVYGEALVDLRRGRLQHGEKQRAYGLGAQFWTAKQMQDAFGEEEKKRWRRQRRWQNAVQMKPKLRSIWLTRATTSDARGLLDSERCVHAMIDLDWEWALRRGLGEFIATANASGGCSGGSEADVEAVLDDTKNTLKELAWLVYSTFDYFARIGGKTVSSISHNAFFKFIKEAKLSDEGSTSCREVHLDRLFELLKSQRDHGTPRGSLSAKDLLAVTAPASKSLERADDLSKESTFTALVANGVSFSQSLDNALGSLTGKPHSPSIGTGKTAVNSRTAETIIPTGSTNATGSGSGSGWSLLQSAVKASAVQRPSKPRWQLSVRVDQRQDDSKTRTLGRHEWLHALVRIAALRYVTPGERTVKKLGTISDALRYVFHIDCASHADRALFQHSNDFRVRHCYPVAMDMVLQEHEALLRAFHLCFATEDSTPLFDRAKREALLMPLEAFMEFSKAFGLVDKDVSQRDVTLAFTWSRMLVVNEHSPAAKRKRAGLSFEDFLEAFVRIALMKAWPSQQVLEGAGFSLKDAGEYLHRLMCTNPKAHEALLETRAVDAMDGELLLPDVDCVRCQIRLCLYRLRLWRVTDVKWQEGDAVTIAQLRDFRRARVTRWDALPKWEATRQK
jgi:hypothetical protein